MKIKEKDLEWVRFAIKNRHVFDFTGSPLVEFQFGDGVNGIRAFKKFDETGKQVPTKHPRLAECLYTVKASINLHIKMWKEGLAEGTFAGAELREYLNEKNAPEWVYAGIRGVLPKQFKMKSQY